MAAFQIPAATEQLPPARYNFTTAGAAPSDLQISARPHTVLLLRESRYRCSSANATTQLQGALLAPRTHCGRSSKHCRIATAHPAPCWVPRCTPPEPSLPCSRTQLCMNTKMLTGCGSADANARGLARHDRLPTHFRLGCGAHRELSVMLCAAVTAVSRSTEWYNWRQQLRRVHGVDAATGRNSSA